MTEKELSELFDKLTGNQKEEFYRETCENIITQVLQIFRDKEGRVYLSKPDKKDFLDSLTSEGMFEVFKVSIAYSAEKRLLHGTLVSIISTDEKCGMTMINENDIDDIISPIESVFKEFGWKFPSKAVLL